MAEEVEVIEGQAQEVGLLQTSDSGVIVERATVVANQLRDVLKTQGLTSRIQNKDYVRVEGWQTVGMMVGITAQIIDEKTEFYTDANDKAGWKAHAVAMRIDTGQVIGGGTAVCTRGEKQWARSDDYAICSMAQTRAVSKALRSVLAWIVTMAGYEATPAEEMSAQMTQFQSETKAEPKVEVKAEPTQDSVALASVAQRRLIFAKAAEKGIEEGRLRELLKEVAGTSHTDRLPKSKVDELLALVEAQ